MTTFDLPPSPMATRAPRRINGKVPTGFKTLQPIVPEWLYYNIHAQASANCMDTSDYLYSFLLEAFSSPTPSPQKSTELPTAQENK